MSRELQGELNGAGLRIGVIVARFNDFFTSKLQEGAMTALTRHGVRDEDITVVSVPGSFEIPLVAKKMAESGRYEAVICLGAVIRGETGHYEHVAGEAAKGIANAAMATGVPVIFGVLTTDTVDQAINRSGGKQGNMGYNAGLTAIEMANLVRAMDTQ
ncbi:MAG: 6,7-dimethyl-8-ribityllumazine synthase [Chloroflexi bacterium]|nr:6,7-dimethyl-8-ribityllumazine synthase [Chloroflexota bacterium]MCI0841268.1 6,7-dimethyl-8-ribityllumazine synthase [Chloroflexota bacterium]